MKSLKITFITALFGGLLVAAGLALAADTGKAGKDKAVKPYTLKTCIVSDEKLGEMGKPYVFAHEGQEMKLCCKGCLKDFNKEPAKYVKKLAAAQKGEKGKAPQACAHAFASAVSGSRPVIKARICQSAASSNQCGSEERFHRAIA